MEFEFEKLNAYQDARNFRRRIYKLVKLLPRSEYKPSIQMRDAARSLTNCLAEGHGRYTFKDRIHFCRESRGSLMELIDDISILDDEHYAKHEHLEDLRKDAAKLLKRLNSYIKYLNTEAQKLLAQKSKRFPLPPLPASENPSITNY